MRTLESVVLIRVYSGLHAEGSRTLSSVRFLQFRLNQIHIDVLGYTYLACNFHLSLYAIISLVL